MGKQGTAKEYKCAFVVSQEIRKERGSREKTNVFGELELGGSADEWLLVITQGNTMD